MKAVPADQAYGVYLEQRKTFGRSPAFYLDCADFLVEHGQRDLGVRVLTDIAELQLQDARLLRVAAHRLMQIGETRELAIDLFEKVARTPPRGAAELPRPGPGAGRPARLATVGRRAMAEIRPAVQAKADYGRALDLLNKVIVGNWPRFPEIELPVLMEANRIAALSRTAADLGEIPIPARFPAAARTSTATSASC